MFPVGIENAGDIAGEQMILQSFNGFYRSGNVMGFIGCGDQRLTIESRFCTGECDYFFQYLLHRVLDFPNIADMETDADQENRLFSLLVFLFPYYLKSAIRKGVYKTYVCRNFNDGCVKGNISIARHIKENTPFTGTIAYSRREYSADNGLMELVRHTIEFIRRKPCGAKLLQRVKDEVNTVIESTPNYDPCDKSKIIAYNKRNTVQHAYYREYSALQRLCVMILQHQKHQLGTGSSKIYGIIFDGAWLWEEYINLLIKDVFYHPMNKGGKGAQRLFAGNIGLIYPDFISRNSEDRIIADAKYKPMSNIGNCDYLQLMAYMLRFDAKKGFYLYPDSQNAEDMKLSVNRGSTYENNVEPRDDICVIKHGLRIPDNAVSCTDFIDEMKISENRFISEFK